LPKGIYQRYKTIGDRELRHYSKHYVRRVTYEVNREKEQIEDLKELLQKHIDSTDFPKGKPQIKFDGNTMTYKYKRKPTIYYDMEKGTFKVTSEDYKKHGKIECSNQAHYVLENVKKCSDYIAAPEGEKPYIIVKYHKRKPRLEVPYEKDAFAWDLWEKQS